MKKSKIYEVNDNFKITEFNLLQVVTRSATDWVIKVANMKENFLSATGMCGSENSYETTRRHI